MKVLSAMIAAAPATAFVLPSTTTIQSSLKMSSTGISDLFSSRLPTQRGKKMSESIPFLECPKVLKESDLAGNFGFDPLGFAKNKEQLWEYREAEIKHARLAMLVSDNISIKQSRRKCVVLIITLKLSNNYRRLLDGQCRN